MRLIGRVEAEEYLRARYGKIKGGWAKVLRDAATPRYQHKNKYLFKPADLDARAQELLRKPQERKKPRKRTAAEDNILFRGEGFVGVRPHRSRMH